MKDLMNKTQMVIHLSVEKEQLHKQVSYYSERFEDFNETLAKSNEAISGFSNEMAKLQKINSRLDKSALDWKKKHHHCQAQLLEATETNLKLTQKTKKLESLCRALQERQKKATETQAADEKSSSSPSKGNQNASEESGNEV